ncbi:TRAP transporter small permease subunit [Nocardioides panacisoli]|uniref:TRAP transporter small permease n=1 Tax=Nocardioides panacisoli TaxID=627624 RepID=UPI001C634403|nr:TRAP transporter small permease subunit [Nocardioides panacisoli]QYJ03553.1 TRAP transporter small permease subunit [Nocardioides panacisoli]
MGTHEPPPGSAPTPPPSTARRVLRVVTAVEIGLAGLAAALIFVLVLLQAGQRYLPVDGWTWTGELARYGLVWVTFTAAGVLVTRDGHIALQLVDELRSELVVRVVHVFALLVVAATGVGFALACWSLIQESGTLTTPSLGMPMQYVYLLPLLGFVSTAIRAAVAAVQVAMRGVAAADQSADLAIQVNGPYDRGASA